MPSQPNSPETSTEPPPSSTPQRSAPITTPKMPRALARLQPHNSLGIKEDPPGTTRVSRHRRNRDARHPLLVNIVHMLYMNVRCVPLMDDL